MNRFLCEFKKRLLLKTTKLKEKQIENNLHVNWNVDNTILEAPCYYTVLFSLSEMEINQELYSTLHNQIITAFNIHKIINDEYKWLKTVEAYTNEDAIGSLVHTDKNICALLLPTNKNDRNYQTTLFNKALDSIVNYIRTYNLKYIAITYNDFSKINDNNMRFLSVLQERLRTLNKEIYLTIYLSNSNN